MANLANNEAIGDFTHIYTLDYLDMISIGTAGQVTIATIPAGGAMEMVGVLEETAVAGTTTLVIDIGTTAGDPDEFIDALDVAAMTVPVFNTGDAFTTGYTQVVGATATAAPVLLEITDANIADATAGKLVIGMRIIDLGRFAV